MRKFIARLGITLSTFGLVIAVFASCKTVAEMNATREKFDRIIKALKREFTNELKDLP
jgi:hypothetical protein